MLNDLPVIHSHDSWSPLEEVWLGDVYPESWYDHLDSETRDVFCRLTDITKSDLSVIEQHLRDLGITVRRPYYDNIDLYLDDHEQLIKPSICPRDHNVVIDNTLYRLDHGGVDPWNQTIEQYRSDPRVSIKQSPALCINGANVVRVGRDIIIDRDNFDYEYSNEWPDHRVQTVSNGGHMDGCFAILKPGLILANHYYDDYDRTFPHWEIIRLDDPTYHAHPFTGYSQPYPVYNGKFWDTAVGTNRAFNQHIIEHALDWVGCYTETYFELNCLVIDTENVMMLASNDALAETLSKHGITVHWVPFRARSFWDGAMHCLTVDIRRRSELIDYFPERGQSWIQ
jgi:hypothetical protein